MGSLKLETATPSPCPSLWLFTRPQHFTHDPVFTRCSAALETRTFKLETRNRDSVALPEPLVLYPPPGLYTLNCDSVALKLETRNLKLETATSRLDRDAVALPEPLALYTPAGLYTLNRDSVALPAALLLLKLET